MATVIFTAGAKGGTGKTTAACLCTTYLRRNGFNPLLLDMDNETRTLSRFFPEAQQIKIDIKKISSYDILINKILYDNEKLIIADLKGGVGEDTLNWWAKLPFSKLSDIQFICIASITTSPGSVQSFMNWASALKDRVAYVVFKNQKDGETFPDYDTSREALSFRETFDPFHILVERLDEEYITEIERLSLTIADVVEADDNLTKNGKDVGPILCRMLDKARLEDFQNKIYDQLQPVLKLVRV